MYAPDAVFWMPSWDDDDLLVENPQTEISLIYYGHKGGLEDRVFRIRTERSAAPPRCRSRARRTTSRNVEIVEQAGGELQAAVQLVHAELSATRRSIPISARPITRSTSRGISR